MRIAVVGSRDYPGGPKPVHDFVNDLPSDTVIISGGARGVDSWAEWAARKRGLQVIVIRPDWDKYGRTAGRIRNDQIVDACDKLVAFWDGKSPGTRHVISSAEKAKKHTHVIVFSEP